MGTVDDGDAAGAAQDAPAVTFDYYVLVVGPGFGGSVTALRASVQAGRAGGAPAALQLPLVEIR